MSRYTVIIEGSDGSFSAYLPDLPGCVATGSTVEEVEGRIRDAAQLHVESLRAHGDPVPEATTTAVSTVDIA